MPAYNFKAQFAELVASGKKTQTIRPPRKRPTKPGDVLYLYTGMRTKNCRKLKQAICKSVNHLKIDKNLNVSIDGRHLSFIEKNLLIKADGFQNENDFDAFFYTNYLLPREFELIKWEVAKCT